MREKITLSNWFLLLVVNIRSLINILFAHSALHHTKSQTLLEGAFASDVSASSQPSRVCLLDVAHERSSREFVIYSFTHQQTHTRQRKFRIKFQKTPLRSFSVEIPNIFYSRSLCFLQIEPKGFPRIFRAAQTTIKKIFPDFERS